MNDELIFSYMRNATFTRFNPRQPLKDLPPKKIRKKKKEVAQRDKDRWAKLRNGMR